MTSGDRKRPARIPLTPEEVAAFVAMKKDRELKKLLRFKKSFAYKFLNIFNILCFFIYWELLFCFLGPCHYQTHYSQSVSVKLGDEVGVNGKKIVSEIKIKCVNGLDYKFSVNDFIERPGQKTSFQVGKDFLLQKELKVRLEGADSSFRLINASPILFLSCFVIFILIICVSYNLNENVYSLKAAAILNLITVLSFLLI
jgi:hypothetical protein